MKGSKIAVFGLLCAGVIYVSACTRLEVYKVNATTQPANAPATIAYALPKKTFLVSVTYVLTSCKTVNAEKDEPALLLTIDTNIDLVASNEVDEEERYYVPYDKLRSWLKETTFVVESYPNQTLKTVNAIINDQAGPTITAAIGTAIKIGALATVVAKRADQEEMCNDAALTALEAVATYKRSLSNIGKAPQQEESRRSASTSGADIGKASQQKQSEKPASTSDARIAELQAKIHEIVSEELTTKVVLTWTPQVSELKSWIEGRDAAIRAIPPDRALQRWLTPSGLAWMEKHSDTTQTIFVYVDVPESAHPKAKESTALITDGLVVRDPALGTVRVCKGPCPTPKDDVTSVDNVLKVTSAALPQLGRKLVLPLHNSIGQNSVLDLSMTEDGVITKLGVKSISTAATSISAVGANVDAAKSAYDAHNKAKADAMTSARNKAKDENKTLSDCLEAQKTIVKDGGTPIGSCQ